MSNLTNNKNYWNWNQKNQIMKINQNIKNKNGNLIFIANIQIRIKPIRNKKLHLLNQ